MSEQRTGTVAPGTIGWVDLAAMPHTRRTEYLTTLEYPRDAEIRLRLRPLVQYTGTVLSFCHLVRADGFVEFGLLVQVSGGEVYVIPFELAEEIRWTP